MRTRAAVLALLSVVCACEGERVATDGPVASAADGGVDEAGAPNAAADAAPIADRVCTTNASCGPARFCSPGGTCVSAVKSVAAGTGHTCAVHEDGKVRCWGYGQFIAPGLPAVTAPVAIAIAERAVSVAAGIQAACALLEDSTVRCWGDLGRGRPAAPTKIVKEDNTPLEGVTAIAGGSLVFCGVHPAGTYCWGHNASAELARPPSVVVPSNTAVLAQTGAHPVITATVGVLVHDGRGQLCGWGNNDSGILPGAPGIQERPTCVDGIPGVLQLSAGDGHVCARRGGATFSCWGSNSGGQLGNGDEMTLEVPIPGVMRAFPADIHTIAAGAYHTCALLETGAVLCWGNNDQGQCGVMSSAALFSPIAVPGFSGRVVAIGSGAGAVHTCAVLEDDSVECWGYDNHGQLGLGATTVDDDRRSPRPRPVRW